MGVAVSGLERASAMSARVGAIVGASSRERFSRATRRTCSSTSEPTRNRPGPRCVEPSDFGAPDLRCQARIVAGVTIAESPSRAFRPFATRSW